MPFDGTTVDETTAALIRARDLPANGWCTNARRRGKTYCALGALAVGAGEDAWGGTTAAYQEGYLRLYAALTPEQVVLAEKHWASPLDPESTVAQYNNAQTSIEPILEWFDKAIGCTPTLKSTD